MKLLRIGYMTLGILCAYTSVEAQTYFRVTSDSAGVVNGELIIGNGTQDVRGALINKGNGVTVFQRLSCFTPHPPAQSTPAYTQLIPACAVYFPGYSLLFSYLLQLQIHTPCNVQASYTRRIQ